MPAITSRIDGGELQALGNDRDQHQHRQQEQDHLDGRGHFWNQSPPRC